jgi:hypothetical protein
MIDIILNQNYCTHRFNKFTFNTKNKKGGKQMVDLAATRARFKATGRTYPGWARAHGIDPASFPTRIHGNARLKPADIEALRADGLLVEVEDVEQADAA